MSHPRPAFLESVTESLTALLNESDIEHARYLVDLEWDEDRSLFTESHSAAAVAEQIAERYGYA